MKTITIPKKFGYPTLEVTVNGQIYSVKSGEPVTVEDNIADAIENAIALAPKIGARKSKLAQVIDGSVTEIVESDLEGATAIYTYSIYNRTNLKSVTVPTGVTRVGSYAIAYCEALTTMVLPESITSLDGRAFAGDINLTKVTLKAQTPPSLKVSTVESIPTTCIFEVPSKSLAAYKSAEGWSTIANQIVAIEE